MPKHIIHPIQPRHTSVHAVNKRKLLMRALDVLLQVLRVCKALAAALHGADTATIMCSFVFAARAHKLVASDGAICKHA